MGGRHWAQITGRTWALRDDEAQVYVRHIARLEYFNGAAKFVVTGEAYEATEHLTFDEARDAAESSLR